MTDYRLPTTDYRLPITDSRALELTALTRDVANAFPPGYGFLADQLRRAAASVVLNFAEGYGKATPRDQRRFFVIARGSTNEVAAALDIAFTFGLTPAAQHTHALDLCDHLARMLTRYRSSVSVIGIGRR